MQLIIATPFVLTTCFGRIRPSSGVSNSPKLLHCTILQCVCFISKHFKFMFIRKSGIQHFTSMQIEVAMSLIVTVLKPYWSDISSPILQ